MRQRTGAAPGEPAVRHADVAGAIETLSSIAMAHPYLAEAHGMLGNAYAAAGEWEQAVSAFGRVLAIIPNLAVGHFALGSALAQLGRTSDAITAFRGALRLNYPPAHCNLGVALLLSGEFDAAADELAKAIAINPDDAVAHWNRALLLLLRGDWAAAWPEYEWRWRWNQFPSRPRNFRQPQWQGEEMAGRTILLHAEQGFGDTIQFIRYLPLVAARGPKIVVEIQPELLPLFRQLPGDQKWVCCGEVLPEFDRHCPLASLPGLFGTTPQTIPRQSPPLRADEQRIAFWRERMGPTSGKLRVGIAWAGRTTFNGDRTRSLQLEQLREVLAIGNIEFCSLQYGPPSQRIHDLGFDDRLIDLGSHFRDFADTAAVMSLCDLIITTDTSVPHLAGAMGRPVWVMLQYVPDWRWMLDREDSPWYPTARLMRQESAGNWDLVVARVVQSLSRL